MEIFGIDYHSASISAHSLRSTSKVCWWIFLRRSTWNFAALLWRRLLSFSHVVTETVALLLIAALIHFTRWSWKNMWWCDTLQSEACEGNPRQRSYRMDTTTATIAPFDSKACHIAPNGSVIPDKFGLNIGNNFAGIPANLVINLILFAVNDIVCEGKPAYIRFVSCRFCWRFSWFWGSEDGEVQEFHWWDVVQMSKCSVPSLSSKWQVWHQSSDLPFPFKRAAPSSYHFTIFYSSNLPGIALCLRLYVSDKLSPFGSGRTDYCPFAEMC